MELRQIRYFVAIAEAKTLSNATEKLNIAQPALSHSIKLLEEELGAELFVRSRKGMLLTENGSQFLESARNILLEVSKAKERVKEQTSNPTGTVTIGMPTSVVKVLASRLFQVVWKRYPNITLNIEEQTAINFNECFDKGEIDLLVHFHVEGIESLKIEPLIKEDLYLVKRFNEKSRLAHETNFSELKEYKLMFPRVSKFVNRTLGGLPQREGVEIKIIKEYCPLSALIELIQTEEICALLPWIVIDELVTQKKIDASLVVNPAVSRTINLITPRNRFLSNATTEIIKIIRDLVKELNSKGKWKGTLLLKK